MNYIRQVIREAQIKYAGITKTPLDYLRHLFYTNGNGIEFENGNPVKLISFCRVVPYTEYYKDQKSFDDLMEYYRERMMESDIDELMRLDRQYGGSTEKEMFDDAIKDINDDFEALTRIDSISDEELKDKEYYKKLILKSKYIPILHISKGYYKLDKFTKDTEKNLLEIGLAISKAYMEIYKSFLEDETKYINKKSSFGRKSDIDFKKLFKEELLLLEDNVENMEYFLKNHKIDSSS